MAKAIATGLPKMRIEEAAARRQARIDSNNETIVGLNKFRLDKEDPLEILAVDNTAVRNAQVERLNKLRAERNEDDERAALEGITKAAESRDNGNLLECAVEALAFVARSAKFPTPLKKFPVVTLRRFTQSAAFTPKNSVTTASSIGRAKLLMTLNSSRTPSAHFCREDWSGRSRPRRESYRLQFRRYGLGCRRRSAFPDTAGSRAVSHVFCHKESAIPIKSYSPELIVHPGFDASSNDVLLKKTERWFKSMNSILIGPGMGRDPDIEKIFVRFSKFISEFKNIPLVYDADGVWFWVNINTKSEFDKNIVEQINSNEKLIMTPNFTEFENCVKFWEIDS